MGFKVENTGKSMQGSIIQQPQQMAAPQNSFFKSFNMGASEFVPSFTPTEKKAEPVVEEDALTKALRKRNIAGDDLAKIKELIEKVKANKNLESKAEGVS
jgi:hypothetical protein